MEKITLINSTIVLDNQGFIPKDMDGNSQDEDGAPQNKSKDMPRDKQLENDADEDEKNKEEALKKSKKDYEEHDKQNRMNNEGRTKAHTACPKCSGNGTLPLVGTVCKECGGSGTYDPINDLNEEMDYTGTKV